MKCLVAYKPCGCPWDKIVNEPSNPAVIGWREHYEMEGCAVREDVPPETILPFCPHGSVAAQLAARLAAAEAEKVELARWLRERIAEAKRLCADAEAIGAFHALNTYSSSIAAWQEVLARVEGKPEGTANG